MFTAKLALMIGLTVPGQVGAMDGVIRGVVVNASDEGNPCGQTDVVLRVQVHGQFVSVEETVTDSQGNFAFTDLPLDSNVIYLPGANRHEIHYPGPRIRLDAARPTADVTLAVRDAVATPCPLIVKQHEIVLHTEPGALHVTEAMLIDNPTLETYVGLAEGEVSQPTTLRLGIPAGFERITFEKELFGRQFAVVNNTLTTGIPWMPGRRWLRFTYTLRSEDAHRDWERTIDLPCQDMLLRVQHDKLDEVRCSLGEGMIRDGECVFQSNGATLAAGDTLQVEFGALPVPWFRRARWIALGLLVALIAIAAIVSGRRRPRNDGHVADASAGKPTVSMAQQRPASFTGKSRRRGRKRRAA